MSYIEFHSTSEGSVRIGGSERARMGCLIDDVAWAMHKRYVEHPPPGEDRTFELRFHNSEDFGYRLGLYCLLADQSNRLLAHVHGQCEIWGWIDPGNRDWFADMIERCYRRGLLRDDRVKPDGQYDSWQDAVDLVRRSLTPVVTSYSVTDSWPNPYAIAEATDLLDLPMTKGDFEEVWPDAEHPEYEDWYGYVEAHWEKLDQTKQDEISNKAIEECGPRWHWKEWGTHWSVIAHERIEASA